MLVYGLTYFHHSDRRVDWAADNFAATNLRLGGAFVAPSAGPPYGEANVMASSSGARRLSAGGAPVHEYLQRRLITAAGGECLTFEDWGLDSDWVDGALDVRALAGRRVGIFACPTAPTWWTDSAEGHLVLAGTDSALCLGVGTSNLAELVPCAEDGGVFVAYSDGGLQVSGESGKT